MSNDKDTAEIELNSKLRDGEYTVTVEREDGQDLTGSVQAEDEMVDGIEVLSDIAPITDNTENNKEATVAYQVTNQYGDDVTNKPVTDIEANASGTYTAKVNADGKVTISDNDNDMEAGDDVTLTLFDKDTGVSTNHQVEITDEAKAAEAEFGDIYNKDDKTLSEDSEPQDDNYYLPITMEDQYGNEITEAKQANEDLSITNTNPGVVTFAGQDGQPQVQEVKIDGKNALALEVTDAKLAGSANVLAISNSTGNTAKTSVKVAEGNKVAKVSIDKPSDLVTAGSDALLPLNIVDANGNDVTSKKDLKDLDNGYDVTGGDLVEEDDGLFIKVDDNKLTANQPHNVTFIANGQSATQTVTPETASVPTVITGLDDDEDDGIETAVRAGGSVTISNDDLIIEDQHGQEMDSEDVNDNLKFTIVDEDDAFEAQNGDALDGEDFATSHKINPSDDAGSNGDLTFKLAKDNGDVDEQSAFTQNFKVIKDEDFESYEVEDNDTIKIAKDTDNQGSEDVEVESTNNEVKVKADDGSGNKVELNPDEFSVTSNDFKIEDKDGKHKITEYYTDDDLDANETYTGEMTVTINDTGDEVTKEVTFSTEKSKAEVVELREDGEEDGDKIEKPNVSDSTVNLSTFENDLYVEDQYGDEFSDLDNQDHNVRVTFSDLDSSNANIKNNGTLNAKVVGFSNDDEVQVKISVDGETTTVKAIGEDIGNKDDDESDNQAPEADASDQTINLGDEPLTLTASDLVTDNSGDELSVDDASVDGSSVSAEATDGDLKLTAEEEGTSTVTATVGNDQASTDVDFDVTVEGEDDDVFSELRAKATAGIGSVNGTVDSDKVAKVSAELSSGKKDTVKVENDGSFAVEFFEDMKSGENAIVQALDEDGNVVEEHNVTIKKVNLK